MKKKVLYVLLILVFICSFIGCNSKKNEETINGVNPVTIETVDNKYYKVILNYDSGISHKDMGKYYAKEIKSKFPNIEKTLDNSLKQQLTGMTEGSAINIIKKIENNLQKEYRDELDGAAEEFNGGDKDILGDGKISKNELYLLSLGGDTVLRPYGCSACAVYGSRSADGKTIAGKNLDWVPHESHDLPAVTIFKQGDKSICSIGSLGQLSVHTGFNKSKIFASTLGSTIVMPNKFDDIRTYPYDIRYALENNKSIDSVSAYISDKNHNYFRDINIFFADPSTSKVLENDIRNIGLDRRRELRTEYSVLNDSVTWGIPNTIVSVNAFVLKGNNSNGMGSNANSMRWESFRKLLNEKQSPITMDDMKEIMSFTNPKNGEPGEQADGSIYNVGTVFSTIFRPDDLKLEISIPPRGNKLPIKPDFVSVPVDFK